MEAILVETASEPAEYELPVFMEHRFGQRFLCGTTVRVSAGSGIAGRGRLVNVSLSGAYLETALPLPLFAAVEVSSDAAGGGLRVELLASVVRRDSKGVGIEWCETPTCSICEMFGCKKHCEVS